MKTSRRIAVIAAREARRFIAIAAERAALSESIHKSRPSFRALGWKVRSLNKLLHLQRLAEAWAVFCQVFHVVPDVTRVNA